MRKGRGRGRKGREGKGRREEDQTLGWWGDVKEQEEEGGTFLR